MAGEEGRVRKFILEGQRAVEEKNILSCAKITSLNYRDKYGNDRQSLIYSARNVFGYYENILIHIESMDIKVDEAKDKAEVELVALIIGQTKQSGEEKILEGEKRGVKIKLVKEEGKWKVRELEFLEPVTIMGQNIG